MNEAPDDFARSEINDLRDSLDELQKPDVIDLLVTIATRVSACLADGGRVLFCGNGGSAADAQHLSAELVGRQNYDRDPLAGIALTVDTSAITAIGNDYGFEQIFARQVAAIGRPGDVLFALSTSGRSPNVINAVLAARAAGVTSVSITGREPRGLGDADLVLALPATATPKIQELTLTATHVIFALVERTMYPIH